MVRQESSTTSVIQQQTCKGHIRQGLRGKPEGQAHLSFSTEAEVSISQWDLMLLDICKYFREADNSNVYVKSLLFSVGDEFQAFKTLQVK